MKYQVIYLTGAPASGKSTVSRMLKEREPRLEIFEYGARLTLYLQQKREVGLLDQAQLRKESGAIVTPEDVRAVDDGLLQFVQEKRESSHVIIDSHAVTKESYGFRVTAFALADFARLKPSQIWVLYASPEVTLHRIKAAPDGRPEVQEFETAMHTQMQASVAITYGMSVGIPVYFFDSNVDTDGLISLLVNRLNRES